MSVISNNTNRKEYRQKVIWGFLSFGIAVISISMVMRKSKAFDSKLFLAGIKEMNKGCILLALISMFGYIWFEGRAIQRIARTLHINRDMKSGMLYGAADIYFSAITPSASGGQPASAYFMLKDGMKGSAVAITLLFNLIFYCTALLSIAMVNFLVFGKILFQLSLKFRLLYGVGLCVLVVLTVVFYLMMHQEKRIYGVCNRCIGLAERWKWVRNGDTMRTKLQDAMGQYQSCSEMIIKDRHLVRDVYMYNVLQRLSQLGVTFFLFMAWKKDFLLALRAVAVQCFVVVSSSSLPIPGAMGVADYLMLNGFTYLLGENTAVSMELLCRGITFYGCVLTGGVITLIGYFMRRDKKNVRVL